MKARVNSNAGGVWAAEEGTVVEVLERAPNGRAMLVRMPSEMQHLHAEAGRKGWLPTRWLDIEEYPRGVS